MGDYDEMIYMLLLNTDDLMKLAKLVLEGNLKRREFTLHLITQKLCLIEVLKVFQNEF